MISGYTFSHQGPHTFPTDITCIRTQKPCEFLSNPCLLGKATWEIYLPVLHPLNGGEVTLRVGLEKGAKMSVKTEIFHRRAMKITGRT